MPLTISVVIPVKDDAQQLANCLRALAAQTVPADEIIVVDNESEDSTVDVARAAGARVVACHRPGIPAASSAGYDAAESDVIARLDADCVPAENWLETVASAFAEHPTTDAVTGGAFFVDGPVALRRPLAMLYLGSYYLLTLPLLGHLAVFGSNLAMRRTAWQSVRSSVHRHDPIVHDDLDLAFHLGLAHTIRFEPCMRMGISMRPFFDPIAAIVRGARGLHTAIVHFPFHVPPMRLLRLAVLTTTGKVRRSLG